MRRSRSRCARVAAAAAFLLLPVTAGAQGLAVPEQGARGMGLGGAYTALAADPSAIYYNAAGLAFLRGTQLYAGGMFVSPNTTFTGADPAPGAGVTERAYGGLAHAARRCS